MDVFMQLHLFDEEYTPRTVTPFTDQLLKWVGNKQRFAHEIISYFPPEYGIYYEPFLGSGAVLGTLAPDRAIASDAFGPLMEIWQTLHSNPELLKQWYAERWNQIRGDNKTEVYERIRAAYNANPNGADLLFISRTCYGGVVRFRRADGYISTPCGVHKPMPPRNFSRRVDTWHQRTAATVFRHMDYTAALEMAQPGDMVYCDPPYSDSQSILYGSQRFRLEELFTMIAGCKERGVYVALSIDGTKQSGNYICDVPIPRGLFEREALVNCGRSMLKRFQMDGQTLEGHLVADRLLLTY